MQDNYAVQARRARDFFLTYDQQELIRKCHLNADERYLYLTLFSQEYRLCRKTGHLFRLLGKDWIPAGSHGEIMTVLDLLCDSDPHRHPAGSFRNMQDFGHQFHRDLNENQKNPYAQRFQQDPQGLQRALTDLGGTPFSPGDVAFRIPVFEDLTLVVQFFLGDEEFAPRLRYLWDENALQYLKYETMYFAVGVLMDRILTLMDA